MPASLARRVARAFVLAIPALLLVASVAAAQSTGRVIGRVTTDRGDPLEGAQVVIVGTTLGAVSGGDGRYVIARVPTGTHQLRAAYLGRRSETREVTVAPDRDAAMDLALAPAVLDAVVVQGVRLQGQAEALSRQMNAANITSLVASDQMGRFPDATAPDALQRVPGVAIERDLGEGRYIQIRGGAPRNTLVTINGEQVPSPEGEARQVALDAVPADVLEAMEVAKAITPDMDPDAIGGSVNLVTRRAPDERLVTLETAGGFSSIRGRGAGSASLALGNRSPSGKFGYLLSGSFSRRDFGADGVEPSYDIGDPGARDDALEELEVRYYSLFRARGGATAALDYRVSDRSNLYLTGVFTQLRDEEERRRLVHIVEDGELEFAHKSRQENLRTLNLTGGGTHQLRRLTLDWHLTHAASEEKTPFDSEIAFLREDVSFSPSLARPDRPEPGLAGGVDGEYLFDSFEPGSSSTTNRDLVGALNLTRPFVAGGSSGTFKMGAKVRERRKNRDVVEREFELVDGADDILLHSIGGAFNVARFNPGPYRLPSFVTAPAQVRNFDTRYQSSLDGESVLEADSEDYDLRERTAGVFAMVEHRVTPRLVILPGVRYEHTWFRGDGFSWDSEAETLTPSRSTNDYGNLFPMVHLKWSVAERTNLRAAFTTAIARPNFYDLVPYRVRDDEDLTIGNPTLRPTTSRNLDFMVERYDARVGVMSAGAFWKRLSDPIFLFTEDNDLGGETTQPRNGSSGEIRGVELALQRQLRFLPGAFSGLGVYANYTFTDSKARLPGGLETRLPGQARHVVNGALSYERGRLSTQVSANYLGNYVLELGGDRGGIDEREEDLVVDRQRRLDLSASWFVTPQAQLFLNAVNLTNEPYVTYQSIRSRPRQREYYEPWVSAGVRVRW